MNFRQNNTCRGGLLLTAALAFALGLAPEAALAGKKHGGKSVGQDRVKEVLLKRLKKGNKAPAADVEIAEILDRYVLLDASGSSDDDGFIERYSFQLLDGDTGDVIAGPETTTEPFVRLRPVRALPQNLVATVGIEDDLQATDSDSDSMALGVSDVCENTLFSCSADGGGSSLSCTPKASNTSFTTDDLLDAANGCDSLSIDSSTKLEIFIAGAAGSRGANFWPFKGGAGGKGGVAGLSTTVAKLEAYFEGFANPLCYVLGSKGGFGGSNSGAGGAGSVLFICEGVVPSYLLNAGGGGGGGRASVGNGGDGGDGGMAFAASGTGAYCGGDIVLDNCSSSLSPIGADGKGGNPGYGGAYGQVQQLNVGQGGDGVGGKGGRANDWGQAGFFQGSLTLAPSGGYGGSQLTTLGGAGGGGYGGGGAGGLFIEEFAGGGGGASIAIPSTEGDVSRGRNDADGYLLFVFEP